MRYWVALFVLIFSANGEAATYYVSPTGNNANSCVSAQNSSTPKLTLSGAQSCMVGGDTLIIKAGTYTNQGFLNPPAGSPSAYTVFTGETGGAKPILRPGSTQRSLECTNGSSCNYIELSNIEQDGGESCVKVSGSAVLGWAHHIKFLNSVCHNTVGGAMGMFTSDGTAYEGGDHLIQGNEFYLIGIGTPGYPPGTNTIYNPGNRSIVEKNIFHDLANGVGIWHSGKYIENVIVRDNVFYNIGRPSLHPWISTASGQAAIHVSAGGRGHRIYRNVIYDSIEDSGSSAIRINPIFGATTTTDIQVYNNTIYNLISAGAYAIRQSRAIAGPLTVSNNIAYQAGLGISVPFSGGTASNNQTTNPSFTNAATGDYTLAAGSTAIDTGANVGFPYCGSAIDKGAFETLAVTAASINGDLLDITVCNAAPPIIPGTFTVSRTGGAPTVLSTSLLGGSGGIVRLQVSETCAAAQTWTVSGGTSTTDSARIGNTKNQPLHTTTNFAVDSLACDGTSAGGAPAGAVAIYAFDGNTNDSSGNANHATSSNVTFTDGHNGDGALTSAGVDSYIATGLLSGHNPSATHLVVSSWVYIDTSNLGQTKDIWGTPVIGSDRFFLYRSSANVWRMGIGATSGAATEFPVVSGWTHVCVKMHPTGDIATMYINGVAGTIEGASLISAYGSYTFSGALRFGLPSGFATSLSGAHIYDDSYIYTTDVSCTDLYNAGQPATGASTAAQVGHQWQGVYLTGAGAAESRGAANAQRTAVKGGAAAVMVQINNETGSTLTVQPRFRYNINGGEFVNVVPDTATADGISYWGSDGSSILNGGAAGGPLSGSLAHTDGITLITSSAIPTITMDDDTSYTLRGIFIINASIGDVVCFKIYDQGGSALASYTPAAGACLTVIAPQANWVY